MAITSLICLESAIWNTNHDAYRIALRLCMKKAAQYHTCAKVILKVEPER